MPGACSKLLRKRLARKASAYHTYIPFSLLGPSGGVFQTTLTPSHQKCISFSFSCNRISLGQEDQSICVYSTTCPVLATAIVYRRWQALTEYDASKDKYVVGFSVGVKNVGLRAKALHQTGHWPVFVWLFQCVQFGPARRRLERRLTPGPHSYALCGEILRWTDRHLCLTLIQRIPTLPLHTGNP